MEGVWRRGARRHGVDLCRGRHDLWPAEVQKKRDEAPNDRFRRVTQRDGGSTEAWKPRYHKGPQPAVLAASDAR